MKMNNVSDAQILIIDAGAQYGKVSLFHSLISWSGHSLSEEHPI